MKNTVTIFGSARTNGNSAKILDLVFGDLNINNTTINLSEKNINYYCYENSNADDDFIEIIEKIIEAKSVIFCTPVYWYSMSARLKTFFDRLSDLITTRKDLGRQLKDVEACLIYIGASPTAPQYFASPIIDTCNYFEMHYKGDLYCTIDDNGEVAKGKVQEIEDFKKLIIS